MTGKYRQGAVHGKRFAHARLARAIGVATVLILMMMVLVITGTAQCVEHGAIRLSVGQAGGDLAAYLINLYCTDGSGSASYLTLLTEGDKGNVQSWEEGSPSMVLVAEGTLIVIAGGGASSRDEQEAIAEYAGEMVIREPLHLTP
jgi:hypothetical protein